MELLHKFRVGKFRVGEPGRYLAPYECISPRIFHGKEPMIIFLSNWSVVIIYTCGYYINYIHFCVVTWVNITPALSMGDVINHAIYI